MLSQEGKYGVEPLLKVTLGIDQAVKRRGVARGLGVAAHGFAAHFAGDARDLVPDLALAITESLGQSGVEPLDLAA